MRNLDIAFCFGVLVIFLYAVLASQVSWNMPDLDPGVTEEVGDFGPPPQYEDVDLVGTTDPLPRIGTAFSVTHRGHWITANSNLRGCETPAIEVSKRYYLPVDRVGFSARENFAILQGEPIADGLRLAEPDSLDGNTLGFIVGYPKGRPGELAVRLLTSAKRAKSKPAIDKLPVISWAETGRTSSLWGDLRGVEGSPVISSNGEVVGMVVGHSRRRGRFYATGLAGIAQVMDDLVIAPRGEAVPPMILTNYGLEADKLRRTHQVTPVVCLL